jgi:hypothetical protein
LGTGSLVTLELGLEDSGPIPVLTSGSPHVRHKEDVEHEHAIPDFYGLRRDTSLTGFLASVDWERRTRRELLDLIAMSTDMDCVENDEAFGLLLIHTQAKPPGAPGYAVEYLDVIMSDRMGEEGYELLRSIYARLVAAGDAIELERECYYRPHPQLDGSSSFKIIRYARYMLEH